MLQPRILRYVERRLLGPVLAAIGVILLTCSLSSQCVPVRDRRDSLQDWGFHEELRDYAKFSPSDNGLHIVFARSDTATIQPIRDTAVCERAVALLHAYLVDSAYWPVGVRMASIGRYAFAWDVGSPDDHSEFKHHLFVFDLAVTRVLFPCRDGLADCHESPPDLR